MPWNWFQDKDTHFLGERSAGGRKTGIGVAQSGIGIDARAVGADSMPRYGPDAVPAGQSAGRKSPRPDAPGRMKLRGKSPPPTGRKAPAAPRGAGGAGRNRNRGRFSRNRVGRSCGAMRYLCIGRKGAPPVREADAQLLHTSHTASPDRYSLPVRCRPPHGGAFLHRPTNARKKTNSHECKTPYANRPAGGCGDASARARTPCPAKCPAKHNTDNHG